MTGTCVSLGENKKNVVSWACDERWDQRWELHPNGSMKNKAFPLLCLDVAGGRPTGDETLLLYHCEDLNHPNNDQIWNFEFNNGMVLVKNVHTQKCLTLNSPNDDLNGVDIIQSRCDRSPRSDDWWKKLIVHPGE